MQVTLANQQLVSARPFLKWAGGKTQLLDELGKRLPAEITEKGIIERYVEPFVGGGAMFFYLQSRFQVKEAFLYDINPELILGYKTIKKSPEKLISRLKEHEDDYLSKTDEQRQELFYTIRNTYNDQAEGFNYKKFSALWVDRVAYMIFLNKTCFNGLFRQNRKGGFNVPFGRYKNPTICDVDNLLAVSKALQHARIELGDFLKSASHIEADTFVYLDPPYRPISKTSSFTSYAKDGFDDDDQRRLAQYFREMDQRKAFLMLSNSDPKNENPADDFFEQLYAGYRIDRALASRMINCDAKKRGQIYELIITNYV